ncbi:hypothetical protein MHI48_20310 [Paenibacillus sp. FSL H7-0942]|uniref:TRADD-N-associated membrane domain-containing protein n=1 Tax=Paenibacillus TaxID=44249 RepID=UPI00096F7264|nr:hypothetical protein [Paenibacillus amylolyticus]OMF06293.1 hypothetical protein BK129_11460 [Paenibacillus amylolyticus]
MSENDSDIKPEEAILKKMKDLVKSRDRIEFVSILARMSFILMAFLSIFSIVFSVYLMEKPLKDIIPLSMIVVVSLIALIIQPFLINKNKIEDQIMGIENEMDLRNIGVESLEKRAEKQFRIHQTELKRYYDLSLNQSRWIFWVGLICLLAGVAIITVTLLFLFEGNNNELIISVTGGVAGMLTNFIGVIFLKMYSETVKSLSTFHERLVTTHHLHFSNFLISKIFDDPLRNEAWAKLALSLTKESNEISFDSVRNKEKSTD